MEALNFHIVVKHIKEKVHKTTGGLELSQKNDKELRYFRGEVVSIGHRVIKEMEDAPRKIKIGDVIHYDRHAGHEIRWIGNEPLKVLKLGDLVAIE